VHGLSGVFVLPALFCDAERDELAFVEIERACAEQSVGVPFRARPLTTPVEDAVVEALVRESEAGEAGIRNFTEQLER